MKMFAELQISFLAQEQKACSHILLQHIAYLGTVGKGEKEKTGSYFLNWVEIFKPG